MRAVVSHFAELPVVVVAVFYVNVLPMSSFFLSSQVFITRMITDRTGVHLVHYQFNLIAYYKSCLLSHLDLHLPFFTILNEK